ncbi:MAG: ribosome biogenesis GTPase Der [Gammaproteobacteria bacterium]
MTLSIAIIGRPNVGKSSLFNRLTRSRNALVADFPGVTRDRLYGITDHNDRAFILIDTGGLCDGNEANQPLSEIISEQSLRAIKEADAVFWLVDGRSGLTATDETLAQQLRSLHAHMYLLVNKTEGLDPHTACAEFHALGMGTPRPVSAKRGDGISELMDAVVAEFPDHGPIADLPQGLRITLIGRPNVGKSTLINRILGEQRMLTFPQPGTTRDSVVIPFQRQKKDYILVDTAGIRRRSRVTDTIEKFSIVKALEAIETAQITILVIDAQEAVTEQDLSLLGLTAESGKSLIIAINKWDGLDTDQKRKIKNQVERRLAFVDYACIHFISALHGSGVGKIFSSIDKIGAILKREIKPSKITEILSNAVKAHSPPMIHGRRIKLRYAHLGGYNPLRIIIHGNQTEHIPASYRRYLSNTFRKQLKLIGTPVVVLFKRNQNPYKGKKNILSKHQFVKRKRLIKHARRK